VSLIFSRKGLSPFIPFTSGRKPGWGNVSKKKGRRRVSLPFLGPCGGPGGFFPGRHLIEDKKAYVEVRKGKRRGCFYRFLRGLSGVHGTGHCLSLPRDGWTAI